MSAIDAINDRNNKKKKLPEARWAVDPKGFVTISGDGLEISGQLDWNKSRYLRVGKDMTYHAFVDGQYYVLYEELRIGYVAPRKIVGFIPALTEDDEE